MAGGLGFEPRLTESESAVLPLDDPPRATGPMLTLGELGRATGLVQADLLALDLAGVTGQEAGLTHGAAQFLVEFHQGAGDTVADGARLAGGAAADDGDADIDPLGHVGRLQGLAHDHARGLAAEELVQRATVHDDVAAAERHEDAGAGGLAAADGVQGFRHGA